MIITNYEPIYFRKRNGKYHLINNVILTYSPFIKSLCSREFFLKDIEITITKPNIDYICKNCLKAYNNEKDLTIQTYVVF